MKRIVRFGTVAMAAALLCALAYAQQQPPTEIPLGDVAKRHKPAKKAKKVVTNDDLPARGPEADTTAPGPAANDTAAQRGAAVTGAEQKAAAPLAPQEQQRQAKIADLKSQEEGEKRIIKKFEEELANPDLSENRRRMYTETLERSRQALDHLTQQREGLEQQGTTAKPGPH
jgi:hypothetical protein